MDEMIIIPCNNGFLYKLLSTSYELNKTDKRQ